MYRQLLIVFYGKCNAENRGAFKLSEIINKKPFEPNIQTAFAYTYSIVVQN